MKNGIKYLTIFLFILLYLVGCSSKQIILSEGYDFNSFSSGMQIYTELIDHNLKLNIINHNRKFYQIWILHKYNSKTDKGNERKLVYEGEKFNYNMSIIIPEFDYNVEHMFWIKILNKQGDLIYKTPILNLKEKENIK
jgi:hypothetical protein